ncbi:MAG: hypothetical protein ACLT1W_14855, partial [Alistipes onderdonkii]
LTLGCAAAFSSCLKNDRYESDQNAPGYDMYVVVMRQNIVALDPFNAAFRLNMLIAEGGGDYKAAPPEIMNTLFSAGTRIEYDDPTGVYTIEYNGSPTTKDNVRSRKIRIRTNGYATLDEAQARWTIDLAQTDSIRSSIRKRSKYRRTLPSKTWAPTSGRPSEKSGEIRRRRERMDGSLRHRAEGGRPPVQGGHKIEFPDRHHCQQEHDDG